MKSRWIVTEVKGGLRSFDPIIEREISEHWFFWTAWVYVKLWLDLFPYSECHISKQERQRG
jgi:hypothetical protein